MIRSPRLLTLALPGFLALSLACGRREPVPDVGGSLVGAIIAASLAGEEGPSAPLLLDSVSFGRVGLVARGTAFGGAELRAQAVHPIELVDATEVLECLPREPCRVRGDASYIEIWEVERDGAGLELVVSRVYNVRGLHVMTRAVTHRLRLAPEAGGWRLKARDRLPT
jgi:hypothetical protein